MAPSRHAGAGGRRRRCPRCRLLGGQRMGGGGPSARRAAAGRPGGGAVVLMHGSHETRRAMIGQARFLHQHGYAVLLFDFHAYGESDGEQTTFGYGESADAAAAVALLRTLAPGERIAAVGFSLG